MAESNSRLLGVDSKMTYIEMDNFSSYDSAQSRSAWTLQTSAHPVSRGNGETDSLWDDLL